LAGPVVNSGDVAELFETLTPAIAFEGWGVDYRVKRVDGGEVLAQVRCTEVAKTVAHRRRNPEALAAIADRGLSAALEYAERAQPPARRGRVRLSIWFDEADNGNLRREYQYEVYE
jgi:hypothetical protein